MEAPWSAPKAAASTPRPSQTWIRRNCRSRLGRKTMETACRAVFSVEPSEISLLHVLFYIRSAGGWDPLLDTPDGAQQDRIVGGSQLISLRLAERLGDRVDARAPGPDDPPRSRRGRGRRRAGAGRVVVAVPPALAGRIVYDPPLPAARDQLTQRMPMGAVMKCMAIYDEPFWREDGLSGQATSLPGPAQVVFDNTPPGGSPGVILGFFEGPRRARARRRVRKPCAATR